MTRKELVYRAIERRGPERTPVKYCNRDFESSDIMGVGFAGDSRFAASEPGMTEWGYVWGSLDGTMGQPHGYPLEEWSHFTRYLPPDPYAPGRFDHLPEQLAQLDEKFICFGVGISGFNQATFLRGFDAFMTDLYTDRDRVEQVLDIVFGFENAIIEQALRYPVDCITFGDDWGTQKGLMISLDLWREVFLSRYRDQFARIKDAGKKIWMHSCGNVHAIIGDWISLGLDVIELLQPDVMGVDNLANDFGGKVCFCCSVDHQRRAIKGTREEIFAYAKHLRDTLGAFNGGFIGYVEDYACLGMSEQNYQWIREAFHGLETK